jgi:hypothetical protein
MTEPPHDAVPTILLTLEGLERATLAIANTLVDEALRPELGLDERQVSYALTALGVATAQLQTAWNYIRQAQPPRGEQET